MKRNLYLICLLLCLFFSACGSQGAGPQTWIDLPLHNATAPLEPMILMAHSSDTAGVQQIDFFVNGEELVSLATGGNRLESRRHEWMPVEPGEYTIQARGVNTSGKKGGFATARITILGDVSPIPTIETPLATVSVSPTVTSTITSTPTIQPPTVTVSITPSDTPTRTPKVEIIEPPTIAVDTTDPVIVSVSASPDPIYHEVCGSSFDLIVRLTVNATDNVAIHHVGGTWSIGGDSGD